MDPADAPAALIGAVAVRRFEPGDAQAVRELHDPVTTAAGSDHGARTDALDSTTYVDDGGEFLVGVCDGRLIATGALRHVTDKIAELERIAVHPSFQRRGFARLILSRLEDRARELGYRQLRLHTTVMQTAAQRLYQTAGYRHVARGQLAGADVIYFARSLT